MYILEKYNYMQPLVFFLVTNTNTMDRAMKKLKLKTIAILCMTSFITNGQSVTAWKLAKSKKETEISYRWVTSKEGKKAREMKTSFILDADIPSIIIQINKASNLKKWSKTIDSCTIKLDSATQWENYTVYKLPWPLKSKDLVTKSTLIETEAYSIIKTLSYPNRRPESKKSNRIHSYSEVWKLTPLSNNKTEVVITAISYDKVKFPRIITDPIIQNKMIASIVLLKKQLVAL